MANPICSVGCSTTTNNLPGFKFCDGAPELNAGEIETIYLGVRNNPFTDWSLGSEWIARLGAAANSVTKILKLTVIADKPKPTVNQKDISGGRKAKADSDHIINFSIDETNQDNHDAIRALECGGQFDAWYETSGGLQFGGNDGIPASIEAGMVIPRGRGDFMTYEGSLTWKAKFTEERQISPLA